VELTHDWLLIKETTDRLRVQMAGQLLGPGEGRTLLDLGAGPCVFARRARDAGWKVTAVDARTDVLPEDMDGITFIQSDVREFDPSGFDTIFNLGLLYHLPIEDQKRLLTACSYTRVILEGQVHTPGVVPPSAEPWGRRMVTARSDRAGEDPEAIGTSLVHRTLGRAWKVVQPVVAPKMSIYEGVIYPETHGAYAPNWRSSIGNKSSFWQTEPSLIGMLRETGYRSVRVIEPPLYSVYGTRKFYVLNEERRPAS
jgi:hypothetical protein